MVCRSTNASTHHIRLCHSRASLFNPAINQSPRENSLLGHARPGNFGALRAPNHCSISAHASANASIIEVLIVALTDSR